VRLTAALAATAEGGAWIPVRFEAAFAGAACVGSALTVSFERGDNLALHRAIAEADRSHIIVASGRGAGDAGHWGSLMTRAALARGIGGLVIDGSIRDRAELRGLGFPVYFRSTCPAKARKDDPGQVGAPIEIAGIRIATGDLVVADEDGVVVAPAALAASIHAQAAEIAAREAVLESAFERGEPPTLIP